MHGGNAAFFGLVRTFLVVKGADAPLKVNARLPVYVTMFLQICRDYPALPDPRTLEAWEIRFFYDGLREELKKHHKPEG